MRGSAAPLSRQLTASLAPKNGSYDEGIARSLSAPHAPPAVVIPCRWANAGFRFRIKPAVRDTPGNGSIVPHLALPTPQATLERTAVPDERVWAGNVRKLSVNGHQAGPGSNVRFRPLSIKSRLSGHDPLSVVHKRSCDVHRRVFV